MFSSSCKVYVYVCHILSRIESVSGPLMGWDKSKNVILRSMSWWKQRILDFSTIWRDMEKMIMLYAIQKGKMSNYHDPTWTSRYWLTASPALVEHRRDNPLHNNTINYITSLINTWKKALSRPSSCDNIDRVISDTCIHVFLERSLMLLSGHIQGNRCVHRRSAWIQARCWIIIGYVPGQPTINSRRKKKKEKKNLIGMIISNISLMILWNIVCLSGRVAAKKKKKKIWG